MHAGPRNLITDVPGLSVGNASDAALKSGVTVVIGDAPFTASVHVMGGAPGTRETDLLSPENTVQQVDALVLSGGSAFGLDAASGVTQALREAGRGFQLGDLRIPLAPAAIIFDLANGGEKGWSKNPYADLGYQAAQSVSAEFEIGTAGAGTGASTVNLKGGLGSASAILSGGGTVGAIAACNPVGSVIVGDGPEFWAAPFEIGDEFGGLGTAPFRATAARPVTKVSERAHTAIAIVATDIALTKAQLKRVAVAAHDGIARSVVPSHTPYDGDLVFALSTGAHPIRDEVLDPIEIGHAAACCLSRAMARGIFAARAEPGDLQPTWQQKFGG